MSQPRGRGKGQHTKVRLAAAMVLPAVIALLLTGCAPAESRPAEAETCSLEASWADGASTKAELIDQAEAVVVGTVEATKAADEQDALPFTDASIRVQAWAKSDDGGQPETIVIRQTGGEVKGRLCQVRDDPLLVVGEQGVFFVRESPDAGVYMILGGPTGRFTVIGDQAQPLPGSIIAGITTQDVAQLIEEVRAS